MLQKPATVIVGTGAVGSILAMELSRNEYQIAGIVSRTIENARDLALRCNAQNALTLEDPLPDHFRLLFCCVPDDAIHQTARTLRSRSGFPEEMVAAHTSGALSSDALSPLGVEAMSFHPMQTFSRKSPASLEGIFVGIEGTDRALQLGRRIARDLGAFPLTLEKDDKKAYHLAASIASNLFVVLMGMACELLESAGIGRAEARAVLRPLVLRTAENATSMEPVQALTGPAIRGDVNTIGFHLETLHSQFPNYVNAYRYLTEAAIDMAEKSGRLAAEPANRLRRALQEQTGNT